jgi:hypothetical protein
MQNKPSYHHYQILCIFKYIWYGSFKVL